MKRVLLALLLLLPVLSTANPETAAAVEPMPTWMRVEVSIIPIRADADPASEIRGYARKGDVLGVEKAGKSWVKLRVHDSLSGWVHKSQVTASGPPVHLDPDGVRGTVYAVLGLAALAFGVVALRLHLRRRAESREQTRQALLDARRRLQNKIQLLFREAPRMPSHLVQDEVDVAEFLRNIGFVVNLEGDPARLLATCKAFKPNLLLADSALREQVEAQVEKDALLANLPVIYLRCDQVPQANDSRVRAHLEPNATDRDLGDAIALCLRKSPARIRYSVQSAALKGEIHGGTLVELLHFLATVRRSGQLLAAGGGYGGEVILHQGEIARASTHGLPTDLTGVPAVESILNLGSGTFEFHEKGTAAVAEAINTQKLLLDWAKTRDERNHDIRA